MNEGHYATYAEAIWGLYEKAEKYEVPEFLVDNMLIDLNTSWKYYTIDEPTKEETQLKREITLKTLDRYITQAWLDKMGLR